nr:MAG TPA: hypothetical protein [Caudoviricetes sp.]
MVASLLKKYIITAHTIPIYENLNYTGCSMSCYTTL